MSDLLRLGLVFPGDESWSSAVDCEVDVFLQAFGNTAEQLKEEYGPFEGQSFYISVSDETGLVVGVVRCIKWGPAGVKSLVDAAGAPWNLPVERSLRVAGLDERNCLDIATLGVRRAFRGPSLMVSAALFHAIIRIGVVNNYQGAFAIMDKGIRGLMDSVGADWHPLPGAVSAPYLGSLESTPVYSVHADAVARILRTDPGMYRMIVLGAGLDGISVPDDSAFLVR